jgi:hypothetical protein
VLRDPSPVALRLLELTRTTSAFEIANGRAEVRRAG